MIPLTKHAALLLLQAHPIIDPDKPRSTSPESWHEGFTEDRHNDDVEDAEETRPVLGSRVWEEMTKSTSEILIVDESTEASEANENKPIVKKETYDDDKVVPRVSDATANSLNRLASWSSSMMLNIIPGKRPAREPPPPDWAIPKPGFKHAETQTLI